MTIAAKESLGVFAQCPQCHRSIQHGFQICEQCGHIVSAEDQQHLRATLGKHFFRYAFIAATIISLVMAAANLWLA